MHSIHVKISGKVALCRKRYLISSNSDYSLVFSFDSDWDAVTVKTARVIFDDSCVDIPFSGNSVALPKIPPCESLAVGVFSDTLASTVAELGCILSVADTDSELVNELTVDQYAILLSQINAVSGRRVSSITRSGDTLQVAYTDSTSASISLADALQARLLPPVSAEHNDSFLLVTNGTWQLQSLSAFAALDGKSAYEIAVDNGFQGTEAAWLSSLKGADGAQGPKGDTGASGRNGKSAYEVAADNGFQGTEAAWLSSLKGAGGAQGPKGDKGDRGDPFTYANLTAADADKVPKVNGEATGFELVDPDEIGVKSWNDLEDKPFGNAIVPQEPIDMPENISEISESYKLHYQAWINQKYVNTTMVRVSDQVFTADDLDGAILYYSINGVEQSLTVDKNEMGFTRAGNADSMPSVWTGAWGDQITEYLTYNYPGYRLVMSMTFDGWGTQGVFLDKKNNSELTFYPRYKGLYFANYSDNGETVSVTRLQLPDKTVIVPLDEKYLPDSVKFRTNYTLSLTDGVLRVNTTSVVSQNNSLPVTSGGVYTQLGNIEALLQTI